MFSLYDSWNIFFFAEIPFVKTSTRIVKCKSWSVKNEPCDLKSGNFAVLVFYKVVLVLLDAKQMTSLTQSSLKIQWA